MEFRELSRRERDIYEGGHWVVLSLARPDVSGVVSDEVVSQVDLAATFADIVGYSLDRDAAIDSYNLLPVLKGEDYDRPCGQRRYGIHRRASSLCGGVGAIDAPSDRPGKKRRAIWSTLIEAWGK